MRREACRALDFSTTESGVGEVCVWGVAKKQEKGNDQTKQVMGEA